MDGASITLIRHGETAGQSSIRLYGATDIPLSPVGLAQARATAEHLAARPIDLLVTSPLRRAHTFATCVQEAHPAAPPLEVIEAFREVDFGDWEGWTVDEVRDRDPEGHARWIAEGHTFTYPNGSHRPSFAAGIRNAVPAAFAPGGRPRVQNLVAVLHKGVIKVILQALLDHETPPNVPVDLASVHELKWQRGGWKMAASNLTNHLPQALHIPDIPG